MKHRTNDDPAKARTAGADDIEANKWAEIIAEAHAQTKSDNDLVHLLWIIQGLQLGNYELEQTWRYVLSRVTNLLETERERVLREIEDALPKHIDNWKDVDPKKIGERTPSSGNLGLYRLAHNNYRIHTLEVIERLKNEGR